MAATMDSSPGVREKADVTKVKNPSPLLRLRIDESRLLFSDVPFLAGVFFSSGAQGAEEDVSTTGFGAESEREVPTGPDPIHHHARGPLRHTPAP